MALPQPSIPYEPPQQAGPLAQVAQAMQLKGMQQGQQLQGLQIQEAQLGLKSQQAIQKAYEDAQGDPDKTVQLAAKYGARPMDLLNLKSTMLKQQSDTLDLVAKQGAEAKRQADLMQGAHDTVAAAPPELRPQVYQEQLAGLAQSGVDTSKVPQQYPGDSAFKFMGIAVKAHTQQVDELVKQSEIGKNTAQAEAANYKEDPNLGLIDLRTKQPISQAASAPLSAEEAAVLGKNEGDRVPLKLKNTANEIANRGIRNVQAGGRSLLVDNQGNTIKDLGAATPVVVNNLANNTGMGGSADQVAKQFGMTPGAFDQQAEKYYTTGQLPQIGRGGNGLALQRALMNRAAELHPDASLASNQAAFKANESSLNALVKQRDTVSAFENTAIRNLDQFIGTAKNVIDSGSPLINKPLRAAAGSVMGSTNQAAFDAARQVALTEIAKVVNNPTLAGQLSDSGRQEVMGLNPNTATLAQIYRVAGILKQDMANRHQAYDEQIADIQRRVGTASTSGSTQSNSNKSDPFAQFGGKAR